MPRTAPKPAQLSSCFSLPPALPARSISGTALSFVLNVLCYSQVSVLAQRSSDVPQRGVVPKEPVRTGYPGGFPAEARKAGLEPVGSSLHCLYPYVTEEC